MTNQSIFDQVAVHALTQMKLSIEPGTLTRCLYRGPKGLKCFIGALIPDEIYEALMEGKNITSLRRNFPKVEALLRGCHIGLLTDLQEVHDRRKPEEWREALSHVARKYDLSTSILKKPINEVMIDMVEEAIQDKPEIITWDSQPPY